MQKLESSIASSSRDREKEKDGLREEYFWADQGKLRESRVSLFAKRSDPVLSH